MLTYCLKSIDGQGPFTLFLRCILQKEVFDVQKYVGNSDAPGPAVPPSDRQDRGVGGAEQGVRGAGEVLAKRGESADDDFRAEER